MTTADPKNAIPRTIGLILDECASATMKLSSATRIVDHLNISRSPVETNDLVAVVFTLEHVQEELERLHAEAARLYEVRPAWMPGQPVTAEAPAPKAAGPTRPLAGILSDCDEHTHMLVTAARLIDHLEGSEANIECTDLAPIRSVVRTAADALAGLHAQAWAIIKAERAEAEAKRTPGPLDALALKINRGRMREAAEAALAHLAELDRLDEVNGGTAAA